LAVRLGPDERVEFRICKLASARRAPRFIRPIDLGALNNDNILQSYNVIYYGNVGEDSDNE
jgi:hypothetical protein